MGALAEHGATNFYPRPPRGGRPAAKRYTSCTGANFYPRPPRGGRRVRMVRLAAAANFYPRPPRGGRRVRMVRLAAAANFYPRPPRGGRRCFIGFDRPRSVISIHALREEGDCWTLRLGTKSAHFYPRPPRGGRRLAFGANPHHSDFYPRPPRGGRRPGACLIPC